MFEATLLFAQMMATGLIAAWLTLGLRDNIAHPAVNETYTAEVMAMTRMARDYPADYAHVAHRAVTNRRLQMLAFRAVVTAEFIAALLLWLGVGGLALAIVDLVEPETARAVAMWGAMAFTLIWAGFLIVGNHFCYWFCHEGAQNTHYQMTLWGLGTLILLAV